MLFTDLSVNSMMLQHSSRSYRQHTLDVGLLSKKKKGKTSHLLNIINITAQISKTDAFTFRINIQTSY